MIILYIKWLVLAEIPKAMIVFSRELDGLLTSTPSSPGVTCVHLNLVIISAACRLCCHQKAMSF